VDNDSADVTSAGRSFQIRGTTTERARLVTVDKSDSDRQNNQTVSAGRTKRLMARKVSDANGASACKAAGVMCV